jgi:hypothetical protein
METRIIKLAPSSAPISVSFEEAFGEYSEARGRGRARRKKRRLERIRNRQEVRKARREGRRERMRERQGRRTERMQLRQERKTQRKQARVERRALGQEEEPTEEDLGQPEQGGAQGSGSGDSGYSDPRTMQSQDQEVSAPTYSEEGDTQGDSTGNGEGEYDTTQEGDINYGNEEDADVDAETGDSDIESGYTGDIGFDGVQQISPEDAKWDEYFSSAEGEKSINPKVTYLAQQIEKTKEAIKMLNDKADALKGKPGLGTASSLRNISGRITRLKIQLDEQEKLLASYTTIVKSKSNIRSNADGDDYSEARGRRGKAAKRAEVRAAKRKARKERKAFRKANRKAKRLQRKENRMARKGRSATVVEMELDPQFSEQRIEVPAEESNYEFAGTGLIGIDDANDYDSPEARKFDLKFSGADGSGSAKGGNLGKIAIGVGLGVLAVYLYNKYKK